MADIYHYLETYENMINGITILDRSFLEMEVLKPIFAVIALVGIHISKSFNHLVVDKEPKYSILLKCFNKLYEELNKVKTVQLLRLNHTLTFADKNIFESCLPKQELPDVSVKVIDQYPKEKKFNNFFFCS